MEQQMYGLEHHKSYRWQWRYFELTSEAFGACVEAGLQFLRTEYFERTLYVFSGSQADKAAQLEGATEFHPFNRLQ